MFIESPRFPDNISAGAQGGPRYSTSVVPSLSGRRTKNSNWTYPLHEYDVSFAVRTMADLEEVANFFHVAEGVAHSFRFKDKADFKSCSFLDSPAATDQQLGIGDGVNADFQCIKSYVVGTSIKARRINKIVAGTLLVALDGVPTTDYTVDDMGLITFTVAPGVNVVVTVGYEFDVPCSFSEDRLSTSLEAYNSGTTSLSLVEERL